MKFILSLFLSISMALLISASSGSQRPIEVYTQPGCSKCTSALNFLKKNWGPVVSESANLDKATVAYSISNKEYKSRLEALFNDQTNVDVKDIKFPVIIMRYTGEPISVYYNIDNVEKLLSCKLKSGENCDDYSKGVGKITYGNYAEVLTLESKNGGDEETLTLKDGAEYTGQVKNGKMHGHGTLNYADGSVYEGHFRNGIRDGQGIYTWPNGDKYDGLWRNNKMHGYGTLVKADGTIKQGRYKNGKYTGD